MGLFGFSAKRPLIGKRIAILATQGVEQVELTSPRKALEKAGAGVELVSPHKLLKGGKIKAWNLVRWGDSFKMDVTLSDAKVSSYDGLHVPGGVINPDILRMNTEAVDFVRSFFEAGKPVSSICHGPWMLIEAEVVQGRTLTSWPSLKKDLRNAGANWINEEFVETEGWSPAEVHRTFAHSTKASSSSLPGRLIRSSATSRRVRYPV